ncbi:MAG: RNA polymerase subunit sigma-24 [Candidatus Meridianibacter frigidus]|nr:MAG: RNA polymerase subunit sigma-24 [Candidatus Eremiobacteraeota bacterium]
MERVRERDAAAFEGLYDAYHRLVYGIALRVLADTAAAEDVTQAVFLKLWSSPQSYVRGNFGGWISRVTRNRALDVLRGRTAHSGAELPEAVAVDGAMEEAVLANLDAVEVRAALRRLPEDQREPIELGFFSGITHQEIAARTGTPLGTIKTRIRSGLRKLRADLRGTVAL